MSGHSGGPPGDFGFVNYVKLSSCQTFSYQCRSDCTVACTGGDECNGNKFPIVTTTVVAQTPDTSLTNEAAHNSPIPSPPTTPEINRVLVRTTAPLNPNSPSTKQYMSGIHQLYSYSVISFTFSIHNLYFSEKEVQQFAEWHALNERQAERERDLARKEKILYYQGNFTSAFAFDFTNWCLLIILI